MGAVGAFGWRSRPDSGCAPKAESRKPPLTDSRPPSSIDAELLSTLERAFARHAGADREIDVGELQRALGLKSEYMAKRVLATFDRDGNGSISKNEFLAGVRALVFGTEREKLEFAFRLHDHDGDGFLDANELERMIAISLAESDVSERVSQPPRVMVGELLRAMDTNRDGKISFEELTAMVGRRPDLLARMTHSEAIWIAPNEDLLSHLESRGHRRARGRMRQMFVSDGARIGFVLVWLLANVAAFVWAFRFGRAHLTADPAMRIARAIGAPIEVNGALILLPMLRRLVTWLRGTWVGKLVPVDDAIGFHRLAGHALFALSVAHGAAVFIAYAGGHRSMPLWRAVAKSHGLTGAILLGVFAVMWVFSLDFVRRSKRFELFYFTHLLYFAWVGLAIAHAPRFVVYAGVPIGGLLVEQIVRRAKRRPTSRVMSTFPLRSAVTRLEIERPKGFSFGAGDYVFLKVPAIARHEWHPFTISSAPELPSLVFHVRSLGNWTAALRRRAEERRTGESEPLVVHVDGPYGSPSAHIFRSRFAVLIGAGIGVTPFASVLESVVLRREHEAGARPTALEKVHFIWLNRDQYSFEWFRGLLSRLEERDAHGLLDIHLCMTDGKAGVANLGLELARDVMHAQGRADIFTGLRTKTHLGPPDWTAMLGAIAMEHEGAAVDVFFCGPHGLARKLEPVCQRLGMRFREEQF